MHDEDSRVKNLANATAGKMTGNSRRQAKRTQARHRSGHGASLDSFRPIYACKDLRAQLFTTSSSMGWMALPQDAPFPCAEGETLGSTPAQGFVKCLQLAKVMHCGDLARIWTVNRKGTGFTWALIQHIQLRTRVQS